MLRASLTSPRRVLMTLDAVGGVWRYALDLARLLGQAHVETILVGFGPAPDAAMTSEIAGLPGVHLVWTGRPLDWMAKTPDELDGIGSLIAEIALRERADLIHVNLPAQALEIPGDWPVVAVSHSCLRSWWATVKGEPLPPAWAWQAEREEAGLRRADLVMAPSASHAAQIAALYQLSARPHVVHNSAAEAVSCQSGRAPFVLSAGRWWDEGKNGAVLDEAAGSTGWPVFLAGSTAGPDANRFEPRHAVCTGSLGSAALGSLMGRAGLFAAPSLYEPFGLSVLEAAWRGTPLLLADIPTFRELWDGAAAFVPPREPQAWAQAIADLAQAPDRRARLGQQSRERATRYGRDRQRAAVLAAYHTALADRSTSEAA